MGLEELLKLVRHAEADAEEAERRTYRTFAVTTLRSSQSPARRELPRTWKLRLGNVPLRPLL